ncbi:hypothetical protein [Bradyrhizobium sp. USDA 329]|uniref:hypothetical protein n=1 Tax=Bradyrhizobium sp. USDA 329 TaxID=3156310 RepID=UPI003511D723
MYAGRAPLARPGLHAPIEVVLAGAPVHAAAPDHIVISRVMEHGADREQARLPRHLVDERIAEMPQEMINDDDRKIVTEIYRSVVGTPEEQVHVRIRQLMNKVATDLVHQPS